MPRGKKKNLPYLRRGKDFPEECAHRPFFQCKSAQECRGCYYNPIKVEALQPKEGFEDEKKDPKVDWFYGRGKRFIKEMLDMLDDIKHKRGLMKGGNPFKWPHSRTNKDFDFDDL